MDSVKVYDEPSSSGKVIDTFGYRHLMYAESVCNETGWYKIIYDDGICSEKNYENHLYVQYSGKAEYKKDIIFSKEAKDIKTGYIDPQYVVNPHGFDEEVFENWNGIEMPIHYIWSDNDINFFKSLCYEPRFTVVEIEKEQGDITNIIGMFVPSSDDDDKGEEIIKKYVEEKGGYLTDFGASGAGTRPAVRYLRAEYLDVENQYGKFQGYSASCKINWKYFEETYGYSEDEVYSRCTRYIGSIFWDGSFGKTEGDYTVLTLEEIYKVCKLADEITFDVLNRPSLREYKINEIIYEPGEEAGDLDTVYYLYTSETDAETIARLDIELEGYKEQWNANFNGEPSGKPIMTQEGIEIYSRKYTFYVD